MDWSQVLAIVGSNIVLFLWSRSESKEDYSSIKNLIDAIHVEMKDFHNRLCDIEEKNKK